MLRPKKPKIVTVKSVQHLRLKSVQHLRLMRKFWATQSPDCQMLNVTNLVELFLKKLTKHFHNFTNLILPMKLQQFSKWRNIYQNTNSSANFKLVL